MPFPKEIREAALVRSRRYCCICHEHAGRNAEVHHLVQEADDGSNGLENAIVLCFKCHAEAGHYNPRHPRGTKYSVTELRKHRDAWWTYCETFDPALRPNDNEKHPLNLIPNGQDIKLIEKEIGILSSNLENISERIEIVRFKGKLLAEEKYWNGSTSPNRLELYQVPSGRYVIYHWCVYNTDYEEATLYGANAWDEFDPPWTLEKLQEDFPSLATQAGLFRIRTLDL